MPLYREPLATTLRSRVPCQSTPSRRIASRPTVSANLISSAYWKIHCSRFAIPVLDRMSCGARGRQSRRQGSSNRVARELGTSASRESTGRRHEAVENVALGEVVQPEGDREPRRLRAMKSRPGHGRTMSGRPAALDGSAHVWYPS
jgi:hypothetical protein